MFLSKELHKFTSPEDVELFQDLLNQRETLLSIIKNTEDTENYIKSDEGQAFIREIAKVDEALKQKVLVERNKLKRNMDVSTAYEGFIGNNVALGSNFDSNGR